VKSRTGKASQVTAKPRAHHALAEGQAARGAFEWVPFHWLGVLLGLAMMPLLASTMISFWRCLTQATLEQAFWKSAEFWFFHVGVILWLICLAGLRARVFHLAYVFGHEWTHALAALCCGGRLLKCPVISAAGGHVVTDRTNLFITLAPYVVPLYSVVAGLGFGIAGLISPLSEEVLWVFYSLLGLTWAFHVTFTVRMMRIHQPDFDKWGRFFCVALIALANIWLLCLLLVMGSPHISLGMFLHLWLEQTLSAIQAIFRFLGA
jgi:hypothetical protein